MAQTEREKMLAGAWHSCFDDELEEMRMTARRAVHQHNTMAPDERGTIAPRLAALIGDVAAYVFIEAPFHCAYGVHLRLEPGVYMNAGCVILDTALVTIGTRTLLGPGVQILCPNHHLEPGPRAAGMERSQPVTIGSNVWLGAGAIVLPGVTIGDNAIVGAGSVVTRDVAPGETVMGNPARVHTAPSARTG